jgi:hypothetical protein
MKTYDGYVTFPTPAQLDHQCLGDALVLDSFLHFAIYRDVPYHCEAYRGDSLDNSTAEKGEHG